MSLQGWIDHLEETRDTNDLDSLINNQFALIHAQVVNLNDDLGVQVTIDYRGMLETYDLMQENNLALPLFD